MIATAGRKLSTLKRSSAHGKCWLTPSEAAQNKVRLAPVIKPCRTYIRHHPWCDRLGRTHFVELTHETHPTNATP